MKRHWKWFSFRPQLKDNKEAKSGDTFRGDWCLEEVKPKRHVCFSDDAPTVYTPVGVTEEEVMK